MIPPGIIGCRHKQLQAANWSHPEGESGLQLVDLGILAPEDTMLGIPPPFDVTPAPERAIGPVVLRAIHERRALDVLYQSMSRPNPARRVIEPHALGP